MWQFRLACVCDWTMTMQVAGVPVVKYCFSWRYWFRSGQQSMECLRWVSCSVVLVVRFISVANVASLVLLLQYVNCKCPSARHASGRFYFCLYSKATCCLVLQGTCLPIAVPFLCLLVHTVYLSLPSHFLFSAPSLYIFFITFSHPPLLPSSNFVLNRPGFSGQWHCSSVPDGHLSDWDMQSF